MEGEAVKGEDGKGGVFGWRSLNKKYKITKIKCFIQFKFLRIPKRIPIQESNKSITRN